MSSIRPSDKDEPGPKKATKRKIRPNRKTG
jgi:hypothetical protein